MFKIFLLNHIDIIPIQNKEFKIKKTDIYSYVIYLKILHKFCILILEIITISMWIKLEERYVQSCTCRVCLPFLSNS